MAELIAAGARLVDAAAGETLAGPALAERVAVAADAYGQAPGGAVFVRAGLSLPSALRYLGAWAARRPVALLDPGLAPQTLAEMVRRYRPCVVTGLDEGDAGASAGPVPPGYREQALGALGPAWVRDQADEPPAPHPDLGVLLATSGSTGDPKLVRLSRSAITHNAWAIGQALHIDEHEIAPTSLPLFYSYGMSVLNSHLAAGATVVIVDGGVLAREFWQAFDEHAATSLAGVPYHYEMLHRIRWAPTRHPSLRTLTQAGGRLRVELIEAFRDKIAEAGGGMHVMYGQTEAGPRMTTLPAERLADKLGSAGPALPGGALSVATEEGVETQKPHVTGEVLYRGPNVMMGYATGAADLAKGDELGGLLRTGDLGHLDEDGYLWLTGRLKRIGKVFGVRVNLDDIERMLREHGPVAATPAGDTVVIWCEAVMDEAGRRRVASMVAERLKLHRSGFDVRSIERLPLLSNGKIDYRALEEM